MTITAVPSITNGRLVVRGKIILTGIPDNVVITPGKAGSAFLGATSENTASRHVFGLGVLEDYQFLCLFIAKIWWMIPRVGKSGREIPMETQMLLLEAREDSTLVDEDSFDAPDENKFYILLLPVLDGSFRASLQGAASNELQFCVESGDPSVQTSQALEAVFLNAGDNPFELIKDSIKLLAKHKGTFNHIGNKKTPAHLDWFGWCTWDAFYTKVDPDGILEGLKSFSEAGCSPKFLIIDDGWQDTANEFQKEGQPFVEGTQFATRLVDIKENSKFKSYGPDGSETNLRDFIETIKKRCGLKYVYMWHALAGYWGGLLPSSETLKEHNPKIEYPVQSPGNLGNLRDIAMDSLEKYGVGTIDPEKIYDFYNDLHSYLANSGVDGVKVDVQNVIATLGSGHGGRVAITRKYLGALDESIDKNFRDNNLICCMCHNSDSIYSSKKSATARASEDFMPNEPAFQTLHIATVSFNSLLLGEIVVPDWDMFHSNHTTAEFHGAARAIGGCAVYVSDKPGKHDIKILKKLVLPDGSVLRARYAGRPTRDCLFVDPVMDGKSLLKIWNLNKLTGVLGVFNCQGAGSWPLKEAVHDLPIKHSQDSLISSHARPSDAEFLDEIAGKNWNGDSAVYAFNSGNLSIVPKNKRFQVSLDVLKCEIFTISPVRVFNETLEFAPLGLIDMYNSGGAIEDIMWISKDLSGTLKIRVRGCGRFGAYSSTKPSCCKIDIEEEKFWYNHENGLLIIDLQGGCNLRDLEIEY
ncbi:probable galactinol--sucrose galactosyltransferase 2 [Coffea eugenioides]|uniref:probable galactinol--sucrose galactosyltransferase 2 n=1 Tax=Coffea eugenioides TaxID=49369 RepID=UPI000F607501|nr:probable galactinol--sucrose galactosyltransferase 2 [Coffea eugenioides]